MDLKDRTRYNDISSTLKNMTNTAVKIGKSLPERKKTNENLSPPIQTETPPTQNTQAPSQTSQAPALSKRAFDTSNYSQLSNTLGNVSVPYGGSTRYESFHPGIDIANKIGTPIPSFTGGTVVQSVPTGQVQGDKGYGNYVIIEDSNGNKHRYSHLDKGYVKVGQQVQPGMVIGTMGNTGQTYSASGKGTGSHLDYRIKDLYNKWVNPNEFIK